MVFIVHEFVKTLIMRQCHKYQLSPYTDQCVTNHANCNCVVPTLAVADGKYDVGVMELVITLSVALFLMQ